MDWLTGIQKAIRYIEDHITEDLDYNEIAKEAACSQFYFQRIFGILCGISLSEYIRNRRLTLAGNELVTTDQRIIDIALKYGYESPESFTRAFSKFHGISPSLARKDGSKLKSFSPLSVKIILKGGHFMDYQIVKKEAFQVVENVETHSVINSQNLNTIPEFWTRSWQDGTNEKLLKLSNDPSHIYGICYSQTSSDEKTFEYSIAVTYDGKSEIPSEFRLKEIPERTWVVFEAHGELPQAIQDLWHNIYTEFFPTSEYQSTNEMDIEVYPTNSYQYQIWIPVTKK